MGTRSLTVMQDEDGDEIAVLYRHWDGYPTGHGVALKEFLSDLTVVNGLGGDDAERRVANGADCLAAQIVAHFKEGAGDFYLAAAGTRDIGEEWVYIVRPIDAGIHLTVQAGCVTAWGLPGTKQQDMPTLYDGLVADFDTQATEDAYNNADQPPASALDESEAKAS